MLHLDHVYPGWNGLAAGVRAVREEVLVPLSRGEAGRYRRWDWHTSAPAEWCPVPATAVLVVEGVGASVAATGLAALSVWIEASTPLRRRRALARDGDAFAPHWDAWAAQEDALFAQAGPAEARVDWLIENEETT